MIKQDNRVEKTKSRKKCINALAEGFSEYKEGYLLLTEPHTETRFYIWTFKHSLYIFYQYL